MSRPILKLLLREGNRGSGTFFAVDLTCFLTGFLLTPYPRINIKDETLSNEVGRGSGHEHQWLQLHQKYSCKLARSRIPLMVVVC